MDKKPRFNAGVIILFMAAFYLFTSFSSEPTNNFNTVLNKLQLFLKGETREVLYLHTNGSTFVTGDTIWFKAYNLRSGSLAPSILGTFLNVSLYDDVGNQKFTGKYKLFHGTTNGQIELPDSLSSGKYILTAGSNFTLANYKNDILKKEIEVLKEQKEEVLIKISVPDSIYTEQQIVQGELEVIGDKNTKLGQVKVRLQLKQGQNIIEKEVINTGENGTGKFKLLIPDNLENEALYLNAQIQQNGLSGEISVHIPVGSIPPIIRFFPESGQTIDGINTKIVFEAIDVSGNPFDFEGIVLDSTGKEITKVATIVFGMGSLNITPIKEEQLYLQILKPKGYSHKYILPNAVSKGYSLQVLENNNEQVRIKIESNASGTNDSILLLVVLRDKVWFAKTATLADFSTFSIPVKNMPLGVAKITVFDNNGIPQAERLVFLNEDKKLKITNRTSKEVYEKKERVNISLVAQNNKRQLTPGIFSVSVSAVHPGNDIFWSDNIMTSLLLTDELKGDIQAKGYYFSENPDSKEALDLLMLTHGWRKFTWDDIHNSDKKNLKINSGLSGTVFFKNGKSVKNGDVTLMNIKTFNAITTKTNNDGFFGFNITEYLSMLDADNLTLTATASGGSKKVVIQIDDFYTDKQFSQDTENASYPTVKNVTDENRWKEDRGLISDTLNYYSDITKKNFWIDDVEVQIKRPVVIPLELYEKKHQSYEKDEDQIHINFGYNQQSGIIQLLHEVAGSFKVVEGGKILFRGTNSLYPENMQGAIFVIDGKLAGFSCDDVSYLNSNDIKNIKVTKSSAAGLKYSSYATGGLIEITTKSAKTQNQKSIPNKMEQNVISIPGYNLVKEFYSPVYKNDDDKNKTIDLRTTLYWNPNVIIDHSGKASLQFFTSDISGEYELRIEGLSLSGIPVYMVERLIVN